MPDGSVDLVYLDPPFNSNQDYNVLFQEQDGTRAAAQIKAFEDTWRWDQAAASSFRQTVEAGGGAGQALRALDILLDKSNVLAYLSMMAPRLVELHRVLSDTGSLFLHCDPTASHYLKVLLDSVFGPGHFRNEVVWCYWGPGSPGQRQFSRKHDVVLWYSKGDEWTFNADAVRVAHAAKTKANYKEGLSGSGFVGADRAIHAGGKIPEDWWPIAIAARSTREYLHYPTQKPEALLERIILAASNKGDLVLDPFAGCGTALAVSERLGRRWIGIDVTHLAVTMLKHRFKGSLPGATFDVIGEPTTIQDAEQLAADDKYQFQWWTLGLVGARPANGKKGPDEGVDGRLFFHDEGARGTTKQIILSVKGGGVGVKDVRELTAVVDRERAQLGALLTFKSPTRNMRSAAAGRGFYTSPWNGKDYPKIQIRTVAELLEGHGIDYPALTGGNLSFKSAVPRGGASDGTVALDFDTPDGD